MRRIISLVLTLVLMVSVLAPGLSVFAFSAADGIAVVMDIGSTPFEKTQYRRISYAVANYGQSVDASISLYLDDTLISGAETYTMATDAQVAKTADVYIAPNLDPYKQHCFTVKVSCSDGSYKEKKEYFTLKTGDSVKLQFMSYPVSLDLGVDIPLAVMVTMPIGGVIYNLRTAIELNGVRINSLDSNLAVTNGQILYFNIPGSYNNQDLLKLNLKVIANIDPMLGEPAGFAEVNIPMTGPRAKSLADVESLVKPVIITAYVHKDAPAYSYASLTGYRTTIPKGTYVAYLNPDNHNSMRAAKVRTQSGAVYWVPMSNIWISKEDYTIKDTLTNEQKEYFVNSKGYSSKTKYLIWVNLERQILTVFLGKKGEWKLVNCFPVATGKNTTPTPTVQHEIEYITRWVTDEYTCSPVLALYDGYAIHNQPVSLSGYVIDKTIGKPASAGCVRMLQKDINWVRSYVPVKTNVVIY